MLPDSKETKLRSSKQEVSPSGKDTWIVLVPCCSWKGVSTPISESVNISEVPGCHLL